MRHCTVCGAQTRPLVPPGDGRARAVCGNCGAIQYDNPKIVVGCIARSGSSVLLCRRAIEPRYGTWTLPAGFMENGESTADGAARETREEAGAQVTDLSPYMLIDVPDVNQVHLFFLARLNDTGFEIGEESLEARLFTEKQIPWPELSFPTVITALRQYFVDQSSGIKTFHHRVISRSARGG
ncbi:MAG: NUDIX hydrolase [Burkholderiales bacterium]